MAIAVTLAAAWKRRSWQPSIDFFVCGPRLSVDIWSHCLATTRLLQQQKKRTRPRRIQLFAFLGFLRCHGYLSRDSNNDGFGASGESGVHRDAPLHLGGSWPAYSCSVASYTNVRPCSILFGYQLILSLPLLLVPFTRRP